MSLFNRYPKHFFAVWLKMSSGTGCFSGTEPDEVVEEQEKAKGLVLFSGICFLLIMHKVAWAEAYNP